MHISLKSYSFTMKVIKHGAHTKYKFTFKFDERLNFPWVNIICHTKMYLRAVCRVKFNRSVVTTWHTDMCSLCDESFCGITSTTDIYKDETYQIKCNFTCIL